VLKLYQQDTFTSIQNEGNEEKNDLLPSTNKFQENKKGVVCREPFQRHTNQIIPTNYLKTT
jgi:hypothetical protein